MSYFAQKRGPGNGGQAMGAGQWGPGNGGRAMGGGQWGPGNGGPGGRAMGAGQWGPGNGGRAMGAGQWGAGQSPPCPSPCAGSEVSYKPRTLLFLEDERLEIIKSVALCQEHA